MESYIDNSRFYIKFFLLDDTNSLNDWGVTRQALAQNLNTFVGQPFIIMPNFGHPTPPNGDMMFDAQEPYKVGTIIEVGIDNTTLKAWGVAEIIDKQAQDLIKSGQIKFVSPSIVFHAYDLSTSNGSEIITNFKAAHVAGVKDPAFGMNKAMIKGQCSGDSHTCRTHLMSVQASVDKTKSPCGCMDIWCRSGNTSIKDKFMNKSNNMTDQTLESLSADIKSLKDSFEAFKKADMEEPDQKTISKQKLFKNKNAEKNDPTAQNDTGSNDYDDDDADVQTPGKTSDGSEGTDDHQTNSKTKQKPSKTVAAELTERLNIMEKQPIVDSIVDAKETLGLVTTETRKAETDRFLKQPIDELKLVNAEYTQLANAKKNEQPYVRYSSASLNKEGKTIKENADAFIQEVFL